MIITLCRHLLLDNVGTMHLLSTPQAVACGHGAGAAGLLCPGKGGGGHVISVTWRAYLVGPPLDGPPSAILSSIVIVIPCLQPSWLSVVVSASPFVHNPTRA